MSRPSFRPRTEDFAESAGGFSSPVGRSSGPSNEAGKKQGLREKSTRLSGLASSVASSASRTARRTVLRCGNPRTLPFGRCLAILFLAIAGASRAAKPLDIKLHRSGMIEIIRGSNSLATIDLNAHNADWEYASQKDSKDRVSDLPGRAGKQFEGAFEIPDTEGGAIRYTQKVRALSEGLEVEYDLVTSKTMKLNGLQVSISLPTTGYAGKETLISQLGRDPAFVGLPKEYREGRSQLWTGEGAKVELGKGTDVAVTVALRAATDVLIQDLRQWQSPFFEVRFPAITDPAGRDLPAGTRFHLDITVTLAGPVRLVGP